MRRDARGPSSTNSAYGQFYDRPSVPATGARDSAHSGADASAPDRRPSAGRRAHAAAERASAVSLDHIPAVVVKASDAGHGVGAFTGAVGRTGARAGSSQTFDTNRIGVGGASTRRGSSFDATPGARTTRPVDVHANGRDERGFSRHGIHDGHVSGRVVRHSGFRRVGVDTEMDETASAPFARATPRAAGSLGFDSRNGISRKPEWNASFATSASRTEARQSRVGADALLSARAAEERRRFEKGDKAETTPETKFAATKGVRVDAVGRRVASLRGAVVSSNEKEPYQRYGVRSAQNKSKSGDFETSSASPLDAADRALGATLKIGKEKALRASSFYETDEDDSPGSDSFLRRTPSASRTRASLERAAAAASSFETLRVAPSPARQGRSPSSAAAKSERPGDARVVTSSLVAGAATVAGGVNGVAKENQDSFFFVDGGVAAPGDFAAGVLDGHGADGARVSRFVCSKIKASLARYFSSAENAAAAARRTRANGANVENLAFITNVDGTNGTRSRTLYSGVGSAALASRRRDARNDEREKLEDVLAAAFAEADKALRSSPRGSFDHEESGCTCVVVVRKGDFLITANVGDSRAVLASAAKKESALKSFSTTKSVSFGANRRSMNETPSLVLATDLSSDHKPDRSDEKARIERTGFGCVERARDGFFGFAGPYRVWRSDTSPRSGGLAVSRAFGDTKLARAGVTSTPEISAHDLRSALEERRRFGVDGDVKDAPLCVILASDGVWDHVSSEAAAIAAAGAFATSARHSQSAKAGADALKVQAAADAIAAKAVAGWRGAANGGYRDDITVVVVPLAR